MSDGLSWFPEYEFRREDGEEKMMGLVIVNKHMSYVLNRQGHFMKVRGQPGMVCTQRKMSATNQWLSEVDSIDSRQAAGRFGLRLKVEVGGPRNLLL